MRAHLNFLSAETQEFHVFRGIPIISQRAQHETFRFQLGNTSLRILQKHWVHKHTAMYEWKKGERQVTDEPAKDWKN